MITDLFSDPSVLLNEDFFQSYYEYWQIEEGLGKLLLFSVSFWISGHIWGKYVIPTWAGTYKGTIDMTLTEPYP